MVQQRPQPQQQINLTQTSGVFCQNCDGMFFEQALIIRKISRVLTATPDDQITMIPVFRCQDCGELLKEFFPEGMTDVEEKLGMTTKKKEESKLIDINNLTRG